MKTIMWKGIEIPDKDCFKKGKKCTPECSSYDLVNLHLPDENVDGGTNMKNKIDREVIVLDFLMRNRKLAYTIDELQVSTNMNDLKHEELIKFKDIDCRIVNEVYYYMYVPFEIQLKKELEQLVKDNKIKSITIDEVTKYSAL